MGGRGLPAVGALPAGLEPEIQKLIAKHKQEVRRLRGLHEAELLQREEQAAQRYLGQAEELRERLEQEKEALGQQERERAQRRWASAPPSCPGQGPGGAGTCPGPHPKQGTSSLNPVGTS